MLVIITIGAIIMTVGVMASMRLGKEEDEFYKCEED